MNDVADSEASSGFANQDSNFPEWKDSNIPNTKHVDPNVGAIACLDLIYKLLMEVPLPVTRHNELAAALQFLDALKLPLVDQVVAQAERTSNEQAQR